MKKLIQWSNLTAVIKNIAVSTAINIRIILLVVLLVVVFLNGCGHYFEPIGRIGVFEIYGGYGIGKQHHEYNDYWNGSYYGSSDLSFLICS
jgi:hypothetical protein